MLLIKIEINILNFILKVYLLQKYKNKIKYLVIYYSRKLILLELNYNIYNKELLKIIAIVKEWRVFLQGIIKLFIVNINYKNLIRFLIIKELN